ncbi:MAG: aminoglycoside phosphotransferase family protein [Pseudonocardiaceae bacterium]
MVSRRNSADINQDEELRLLRAHGLSPAALLARGTEAHVYATGTDRVLKVYAGVDQADTLRTLQDFYSRLRLNGVGFALPVIHDITPGQDLLAVTEQRIAGSPISERPEHGHDADLQAAYLDAVVGLGQARVEPAYDRVLLLAGQQQPGHQASDWHGFLRDMIRHQQQSLGLTLELDWPGAAAGVARLLALFSGRYVGRVGVIHGDLFPGNVLVDDNGTVTGIIDFGTFTMFGDPLYDLATACAYYNMYDSDQAHVRAKLLNQAAARVGDQARSRLQAYVLVAALLSCDLYPDPQVLIRQTGHWKWALSILNDPASWELLS